MTTVTGSRWEFAVVRRSFATHADRPTPASRRPTAPSRWTCSATLLQVAGIDDAANLYHDLASGGRADRPGFDSCLRALRKGDVLVVGKLDRLGRNLRPPDHEGGAGGGEGARGVSDPGGPSRSDSARSRPGGVPPRGRFAGPVARGGGPRGCHGTAATAAGRCGVVPLEGDLGASGQAGHPERRCGRGGRTSGLEEAAVGRLLVEPSVDAAAASRRVRRPSPRPRGGRARLSTGSGSREPRRPAGGGLGTDRRVSPVVPPAGAEVVPAGTADRGDALGGMSAVTVPDCGGQSVSPPPTVSEATGSWLASPPEGVSERRGRQSRTSTCRSRLASRRVPGRNSRLSRPGRRQAGRKHGAAATRRRDVRRGLSPWSLSSASRPVEPSVEAAERPAAGRPVIGWSPRPPAVPAVPA